MCGAQPMPPGQGAVKPPCHWQSKRPQAPPRSHPPLAGRSFFAACERPPSLLLRTFAAAAHFSARPVVCKVSSRTSSPSVVGVAIERSLRRAPEPRSTSLGRGSAARPSPGSFGKASRTTLWSRRRVGGFLAPRERTSNSSARHLRSAEREPDPRQGRMLMPVGLRHLDPIRSVQRARRGSGLLLDCMGWPHARTAALAPSGAGAVCP